MLRNRYATQMEMLPQNSAYTMCRPFLGEKLSNSLIQKRSKKSPFSCEVVRVLKIIYWKLLKYKFLI